MTTLSYVGTCTRCCGPVTTEGICEWCGARRAGPFGPAVPMLPLGPDPAGPLPGTPHPVLPWWVPAPVPTHYFAPTDTQLELVL